MYMPVDQVSQLKETFNIYSKLKYMYLIYYL